MRIIFATRVMGDKALLVGQLDPTTGKVTRICNGRKYIIRLNKSRSGYYKTAEDAIQARISYLESKIEDANKEIVMLKGTKNTKELDNVG